jgi:hypothetical protein
MATIKAKVQKHFLQQQYPSTPGLKGNGKTLLIIGDFGFVAAHILIIFSLEVKMLVPQLETKSA